MGNAIVDGESGWPHLQRGWLCAALFLGCASGDARMLAVQDVPSTTEAPSGQPPSAVESPGGGRAISPDARDGSADAPSAISTGNYGTSAVPTACPGCLIHGRCFATGDHDPTNPCRLCAPESNAAAWWNEPDGTACDDQSPCSVHDVCRSGACTGTPRDCSDDRACTAGERCDPALGCMPGRTSCDSGEFCLPSGECGSCDVEQCNIEGSCFEPQQLNPGNPCERCDPATSATAWSPLADGSSCDDGTACTDADACSGGVCTGSARSCDDGVFCNGVETCVEEKGTCRAAGGTSPCVMGCIESERMCASTVGQCIDRDVGARFCSDGSVFACVEDGVAEPVEQCAIECRESDDSDDARCTPVHGAMEIRIDGG